jgi:Tol biopolymer transport system component
MPGSIRLGELDPPAKGDGSPTTATTGGDFKQHLRWSPDGMKFLFTRPHQGKVGLWTMNADGGDLKPLLAQTTPHFDGHWSPDARLLAFLSNRGGYDVCVMDPGELLLPAK